MRRCMYTDMNPCMEAAQGAVSAGSSNKRSSRQVDVIDLRMLLRSQDAVVLPSEAQELWGLSFRLARLQEEC